MADTTRDGKVLEIWFDPDLTDYKPVNLSSKSDKGKIFVSWDIPIVDGIVHPDIRGYRIYHSVNGTDYFPVSNLSINFPRPMTFFADYSPGTHYFKVKTIFKHGYESPLSDVTTIVHREGYGH